MFLDADIFFYEAKKQKYFILFYFIIIIFFFGFINISIFFLFDDFCGGQHLMFDNDFW